MGIFANNIEDGKFGKLVQNFIPVYMPQLKQVISSEVIVKKRRLQISFTL